MRSYRRTSVTNIAIVSVTIVSLAVFVLSGLPTALAAGSANLFPFFHPTATGKAPLPGFLEASALMFVAYTGYGRIATLGEEIHDPKKNIPRAIIVTLVVSMVLYVAVGLVGISAVGAEALGDATKGHAAPLAVVADQFRIPWVGLVVALGAVTAMLGVLLNLILGLSRVVLAMGRRGDAPSIFGKLDGLEKTPYVAVVLVGVAIAGLTLIGSVKTNWSFSAFTVLVYYALTNLSAIRLSPSERLYPRFVPWAGLVACLFLAFWVEPTVWLSGLALIAAGLVWHTAVRRFNRPTGA